MGGAADFFHATVSGDEKNEEKKKRGQCEDILIYLEAPSTKQCDRRSQ